MKKRLPIFLSVILFVLLCGCSVKSETSYLPSDANYSKEMSAQTPEGLAKISTDTYVKMLKGDLTPEEGFDSMLQYAPAKAAEQMAPYKEQFAKEINDTREYFEANSESIDRYEFSKTDYKSDNEASIYRIQYLKSGKKYYFVQDFIKEDGTWKVKGDNISDPFAIKKKFLFWYL